MSGTCFSFTDEGRILNNFYVHNFFLFLCNRSLFISNFQVLLKTQIHLFCLYVGSFLWIFFKYESELFFNAFFTRVTISLTKRCISTAEASMKIYTLTEPVSKGTNLWDFWSIHSMAMRDFLQMSLLHIGFLHYD